MDIITDLKFKRSIVEFYECSARGTDPFQVTLNNNLGSISVSFCYGAKSTSWGSAKGDVREFVLKCNDYYITQSLCPGEKRFYLCRTRTNLNKTIDQAFRSGKITFDQMLETRHHIKDLDEDSSYNSFLHHMYDCPNIEEVWDYCENYKNELFHCGFEETHFDLSPDDQFFMKKIWPAVKEVLRKTGESSD